jgi:hypothetical protein
VQKARTSASGTQNDKALFCMVGWDRCDFHKKHSRRRYVEHVFLHPVGYAGHIVHSGASGARNIDTLFFMLMCDLYGFHKKRVGTCYAKLLFCIRWNDEDITSLDTTLLVTFNSKVK